MGKGGDEPRASAAGIIRKQLTPLSIALLAVAGTVIMIAVIGWIAWWPDAPRVVLDVPAPSPEAATGSLSPPADAAGALATKPALEPDVAPTPDEPLASAADIDPAVADDEGRAEEVGMEDEAVDEVIDDRAAEDAAAEFVETPMRVTRRSNIRNRPTPRATALGRAEVGSMVILLEPEPVRGYYRIDSGNLEGWIWGSNIAAVPPPADLAPESEGDFFPEEDDNLGALVPEEAAPVPEDGGAR